MRAMVGVLAVGMIAVSGCGGGEPAAAPAASATTGAAATAASASAAMPVTPVATPTAAGVIAYTVVQPKTLLGRAPATETALKEDGVKAGNAWGSASQTKASGAYGTAAKKNVIVFAAAVADVPDPAAMVEQVATQSFAKYTFHPVDAGRGGAGRCSDSATGGGTPTTLCLWADNYAAGIFYFFFVSGAAADTLLPQARAEVEVDKNK
ncbi:hypothetical protein Dvina_20880 [Dactylosporangium vinaceum]|uniref:Lipoprotein n=1 Tax=Dactylosporangium vinaceum TaxID=53362 RepID=A0ABV5MRY3_9ACTN|nr:hypothetical protein [Dactylosporangium vinaceum]UAC00298.1 hypothetical protein Dvina_20880 [Dactylosporangium vinaceum]